MYFTSGMQKNKKKKSRHCHIIDSAESHGIGSNVKNLYFTMTESIKKINYRRQNQKSPILQGVKPYLTH